MTDYGIDLRHSYLRKETTMLRMIRNYTHAGRISWRERISLGVWWATSLLWDTSRFY